MKEKSNLTLFMEQLIRSLKEEERFSTAHIYQSTLNAFMLFCKTDTIRFNQMERSYLKNLRTICVTGMHLEHCFHLYAYLAKHLQQSRGRWSDRRKAPSFPSRIYWCKSQYQTRPRCQRHEQIIKCLPSTLLAAKYGREPGMDYPNVPVTRDALCGSGTPAQNRPARFRYLLPRHKTGTLLTVEIPPAAMNLIKRYQNTDSNSPYLLPILSGNRKSEEEYAEYQHALRKLNYDLKQLAVYCGIKLNVSSYTSRHTWATLAKYCHFSEQLIVMP